MKRKRVSRTPRVRDLGNEQSTGTACHCGHAVEEHGNNPEYPGSTECSECDCIAYEVADA